MTVTGPSCIDKERQALLMFKGDLKDINDSTLNDWSNEEGKRDCCKWSFVSCNNLTGHVTKLDFSNFTFAIRLSGKISPSLKVLKQLQYLDLSYINFQSSHIPNFLGSLTNLQDLHLYNANLSGPIPLWLENLANLKSLNLGANSLVGSISHQLGNLSNLKSLQLLSNRLSGDLPNSVGQLSNLEYLDISYNSLRGVISDPHFINLSSLTLLDMSFNSFSFNFSSDFRFPFQLYTINLQSCNLGPSFPVWLKSQIRFKSLDISSNGISDGVPRWFWNVPLELWTLNVSSNELKGTLPDITLKFYNYPGLDLSNNRFEGRVPLFSSKFASLDLSGNKFKGNLSFLCHINGDLLTFIDLSNNSFSGNLPDCWSRFQKLVVLDLSYNNLSGNIPLSFGFLNQLEALYLQKNAFVGELPMSLSNCTNLTFVNLGENKLIGKIPVWVGERLTRLYCLVLRSNMLSGSLPPQICWLYNLRILDLSNNKLVGNLPSCFGNFSSMSNRSGDDVSSHVYFQSSILIRDTRAGLLGDFNDNAFVAWKGTYQSFGRNHLDQLNIIDLSNNNLSGEFPFEITSLVELVSFNISLNKLHGKLPKDIGLLKSLNSLDLSRNQFSGKIPSSLSQLDGLGYLDLSYNNLSGETPTATQFQRFDSSSYEGNPLLYGPPLTPISRPTTIVVEEDVNHIHEYDDDFWKSYYMGMSVGFVVGFWGICGVIFLNRRCRHLLFTSLSLANDCIYVTLVVLYRKFKRL
ncbi:receptor-like protein EIX2 [Rutidosis leptorrhynchoides]|uniref:receptor-like protein EIX2 n=1 Tax=Rutidosis leptorrhynchoides TaxID=125765 RepID=UPI003A9972DF